MKFFKKITLTLFLVTMFNQTAISAPYVNIDITYDGKTHKYNNEKVYLYVNSKMIDDLPMEPIIFDDYTLVPARETFENIGATVEWFKETEEVKIIYNDTVILMEINNKNALVNGKTVEMQIAPKLINAKTMIPVRFVSESIGLIVDWDNSTRIINIQENITQTDSETNNTQADVLNPSISINNIYLPDSDETTFTIVSDSPIETFEKILLDDGSISVDIYNSKNNITQTKFNSVIDSVSQVEIESLENNITRFIFKTEKSVLNNCLLSDDKKTLFVNFGGNPIKVIETSSDEDTDILKIYGEYNPEATFTKRETENKIIVQINNATMSSLTEKFNQTNYIDSIKYNNNDNNGINVEIYLNKDVDVISYFEENAYVLKFGENIEDTTTPVDSNSTITATAENQFVIPKSSSMSININNITHTDNYLDRQYILTFDKNISSLIQNNTYDINSTLVKNIVVENVNGLTQLTINSNQIIAVNVTEDNSNIYINILLPKEKYKNIVVIDPGHGGSAPGTIGNNLVEKDVNLDVALRLNELFKANSDIQAYFTRLDDVNPSFDDRTDLSNEVADFFISIHHNSTDSGTSANGTEVLYLNPNTSDRGLTSQVIAEILQRNLLNQLNTLDRSIKSSNLIVLRNNTAPAVLCEIGFLSNPTEAAKIATPEFRQKSAQAIYDACLEIIEKYPSTR